MLSTDAQPVYPRFLLWGILNLHFLQHHQSSPIDLGKDKIQGMGALPVICDTEFLRGSIYITG